MAQPKHLAGGAQEKHETVGQYSRSPTWHLNPGHSEYEALYRGVRPEIRDHDSLLCPVDVDVLFHERWSNFKDGNYGESSKPSNFILSRFIRFLFSINSALYFIFPHTSKHTLDILQFHARSVIWEVRTVHMLHIIVLFALFIFLFLFRKTTNVGFKVIFRQC